MAAPSPTSCGVECLNCNNDSANLAFCVCEYPWSNLGDFYPVRNIACNVHIEVNKALHYIGAIIWGFATVVSFLAVLLAKRSSSWGLFKERTIIFVTLLSSIFTFAWHSFELSETVPGEHAAATSLTSTVFWHLGMVFCFTFVFSIVFVKSGTSVVPFAMDHAAPNVKRLVAPVTIGLGLFCQLSLAIPYAAWAAPEYTPTIIAVSYICTALWTALVTFALMFATHKMMSNMRGILATSDLNATRRGKVLVTYQMAKKIRIIAFIGFLQNVPFYIAFACSIHLATFSYVLISINSIFLGLVILRHSTNSFRISRDFGQSSNNTKSGGGHKMEEPKPDEPSGDVQHDSEFFSENSPAETPSPTNSAQTYFMRTLGRPPKKKYATKKMSKKMTRVTEERTIDKTTSKVEDEEKLTNVG